MRIMLSAPNMGIGGAERVVAMLATGLSARGHEIVLAAPPGVRDADLGGVAHKRVALDDHGRAIAGAVHTAVQLASAVRRSAPDIVHAQNVKSAAIARAASAAGWPRRRPPVLATFHGVLPADYRRSARVLSHVDHVACVSGSALEQLLAVGLPAWRASVVRNAVTPAPPLDQTRRAELDRELELEGRPVVAIVGRLVAQKAHARFVVAAGVIAEAVPQTRFLVVGDGPLRGQVERQVRAAGLADRVLFTGPRSDARGLIARADVVVFSSEWEGLSITALEALAAGTPVVSTDVQGMRELLLGEGLVAGAIVPLDDGLVLGERVAVLLRDEDELAAMGRAGRELTARNFSIDGMIDAYERLYERLIGFHARQ
jgi:glycosyltransferase involved in cell wall biosynthesis